MKTSDISSDETLAKPRAADDRKPTALARVSHPALASKRNLALGALAAGAAALLISRLLKRKSRAASKTETVLHVVPDDQVGWKVKDESATGTESSFETKKEALDSARELARSNEPSRLVVHGEDGAIQRSHTYGTN